MLVELAGRSFADRFDRMKRSASAVCVSRRATRRGARHSKPPDPYSAQPCVPPPTWSSAFPPSLPRKSLYDRCRVLRMLHRPGTATSVARQTWFGLQLPFTPSPLDKLHADSLKKRLSLTPE